MGILLESRNLYLALQELDDVYHDVSGVVLESLTEGSKKITEKVHFIHLPLFNFTIYFIADC